jgi:hypothetical protein
LSKEDQIQHNKESTVAKKAKVQMDMTGHWPSPPTKREALSPKDIKRITTVYPTTPQRLQAEYNAVLRFKLRHSNIVQPSRFICTSAAEDIGSWITVRNIARQQEVLGDIERIKATHATARGFANKQMTALKKQHDDCKSSSLQVCVAGKGNDRRCTCAEAKVNTDQVPAEIAQAHNTGSSHNWPENYCVFTLLHGKRKMYLNGNSVDVDYLKANVCKASVTLMQRQPKTCAASGHGTGMRKDGTLQPKDLRCAVKKVVVNLCIRSKSLACCTNPKTGDLERKCGSSCGESCVEELALARAAGLAATMAV